MCITHSFFDESGIFDTDTESRVIALQKNSNFLQPERLKNKLGILFTLFLMESQCKGIAF